MQDFAKSNQIKEMIIKRPNIPISNSLITSRPTFPSVSDIPSQFINPPLQKVSPASSMLPAQTMQINSPTSSLFQTQSMQVNSPTSSMLQPQSQALLTNSFMGASSSAGSGAVTEKMQKVAQLTEVEKENEILSQLIFGYEQGVLKITEAEHTRNMRQFAENQTLRKQLFDAVVQLDSKEKETTEKKLDTDVQDAKKKWRNTVKVTLSNSGPNLAPTNHTSLNSGSTTTKTPSPRQTISFATNPIVSQSQTPISPSANSNKFSMGPLNLENVRLFVANNYEYQQSNDEILSRDVEWASNLVQIHQNSQNPMQKNQNLEYSEILSTKIEEYLRFLIEKASKMPKDQQHPLAKLLSSFSNEIKNSTVTVSSNLSNSMMRITDCKAIMHQFCITLTESWFSSCFNGVTQDLGNLFHEKLFEVIAHLNSGFLISLYAQLQPLREEMRKLFELEDVLLTEMIPQLLTSENSNLSDDELSEKYFEMFSKPIDQLYSLHDNASANSMMCIMHSTFQETRDIARNLFATEESLDTNMYPVLLYVISKANVNTFPCLVSFMDEFCTDKHIRNMAQETMDFVFVTLKWSLEFNTARKISDYELEGLIIEQRQQPSVIFRKLNEQKKRGQKQVQQQQQQFRKK